MCGIAGHHGIEAPLSEARVQQSLRRLQHRGPDDRGVYRHGCVTLAHTRLSIIDLAGGHQPLTTDDDALVAVVNGEIYNYVELGRELRALGCRFRTESDSEVLLHGYAVWGEAVLDRLAGMYAFALLDRRRNRLLLGRDRLGMKPLFLSATPDGVAFASEIKALLPLLPRRPELAPAPLLRHLQNQFSAGRETVLDGVERVLPGELVTVEAGRVVSRRRYWSATRVSPREIDFDTAAAEFDELFDTVMREHMRSDVPFGLFLSGGVDSSILLAGLARLRGEPTSTYSVGFDSPGMVDELPLAARMAERYGSRHHPIAPDGPALLARLPRSIWAADDLMRDYANLPTLYLAEQASRDLKVVFSGEGGDEAFGGYGRYRVNAFERFIKRLLFPGSGGFRTGGLLRARSRRHLLGEALAEVSATVRDPVIAAWREAPAAWSDLQRMQYVDLSTALPDNLLVKADRMLMVHGLEGRLPFVDHRIVEFGLSLPDALKTADGQGKVFLKRWAERLVEPELLYAPKRGFHVPVRGWFEPELDRLARLMPSHPVLRAWFRSEGLRALFDEDRARGRLSRAGFALIQFALWHRVVLDEGDDPGDNVDVLALLEDG